MILLTQRQERSNTAAALCNIDLFMSRAGPILAGICDHEKLLGGRSVAYDIVERVQKGVYSRPVAPHSQAGVSTSFERQFAPLTTVSRLSVDPPNRC